MSVERFANSASSTLSADATAGATSLSITSVTAFPSGGNFRVRVGTELIIVRNVSGSSFTDCIRGAEGTTAASHTAGNVVTLVATAQSLVAGPLSRLYGPFRDAPPTSGWTWVNQGDATMPTDGVSPIITAPVGADAHNLHALVKSAPAAPYTVTAWIHPEGFPLAAFIMGLVWRESSSGKLVTAAVSFNNTVPLGAWEVVKWNSPTSWDSTPKSVTKSAGMMPLGIRLADDNTNRIISFSINGYTWHPIFSEGRTTFITADQIGWFMSQYNSAYVSAVKLLSWDEA